MASGESGKTKITVVTPYRDFLEGETESVVIPTIDGEIGIMAGHTPLLIALKPGVAMIRTGSEKKFFTVSEGFAEVSDDHVLIVCNSAEYPEDINIRRMCDSFKKAVEAREASKTIEDPTARQIADKEVAERLGRARARRHLIELYGEEQQKQRLSELRTEYNWQ